ncbi:Drebrin-like protein [Halotydeus destructor]|nr:Drebrin-like protein [Halotydeus destructor]
MAVNFYRHREELLSSYKEVQDSKNKKTDWVVFGYCSQTNDLEVAAKGYGLEDLSEELNSCKIQYAFCRVQDPNTDLPKFVLINWIGEGAPLARKGVCANHIADVANFFKGVHVTINARTEEDILPAVIINRVIKGSTTKINFKERSDPTSVDIKPVGSNYQRVQPRLEVNSTEREKFWTQQQDEEKKRKVAEKRAVEEERKKADETAKQRDMAEAKDREQALQQKDAEINRQREAERNAENTIRNQNRKSFTGTTDDGENPEHERAMRTEAARRARTDEAKSLISGGSIKNVRAMFEQNSSAGQMNTTKPPITVRKLQTNGFPKQPAVTEAKKEEPAVVKAEPKPVPVVEPVKKEEPVKVEPSVAKTEVTKPPSPEPPLSRSEAAQVTKHSTSVEDSSRKPIVTNGTVAAAAAVTAVAVTAATLPIIQNIPERVSLSEPDAEEVTASPQPTEDDDEYGGALEDEVAEDISQAEDIPVDHQEVGYAQVVYAEPLEDIVEEEEDESESARKADALAQQQASTSAASASASTLNESMGLRARALYDYQAADDTEITFDPDDIITHIEQIDEGWWQGMGPDGTYGLFPANYVELLD